MTMSDKGLERLHKAVTGHTPGPWHLLGTAGIAADTDPGWGSLATVWGKGPESEANAKFIVRAVNSHEALLEALEEVSTHLLAAQKIAKSQHRPELVEMYARIGRPIEPAIRQARGEG